MGMEKFVSSDINNVKQLIALSESVILKPTSVELENNPGVGDITAFERVTTKENIMHIKLASKEGNDKVDSSSLF
jgi:hypothetical protein